MRQWVIESQVANSILLEKKLFDDELNLRERLEAMIDRKVKHLIQLKAMKQMLRQTSAARDDEQPKTIAARRGLQSTKQKARNAAAEKSRVHFAAGGLNVPPAANWREIA